MTRIRIDRVAIRVRNAPAGGRAALTAAIARSLATHPALTAAAGDRAEAAGRSIAESVGAAVARKERR